jgi:hypothetical protein
MEAGGRTRHGMEAGGAMDDITNRSTYEPYKLSFPLRYNVNCGVMNEKCVLYYIWIIPNGNNVKLSSIKSANALSSKIV